MVNWLDEAEQRAWMALIHLRQHLDAEINAGYAAHGLSAADYELLVPLSAAPGDQMRAKDLAAEVCWDKARLSKHLARMDARGLVSRETAADDGRGIVVTLTPHGRKVLEAAAPTHVEIVRRLFIDHMTEMESEALQSLSRKVVAATHRD